MHLDSMWAAAVRDLTAELKKIRGDYRLFATDRCAVCGYDPSFLLFIIFTYL
jgi:hypothetical protein